MFYRVEVEFLSGPDNHRDRRTFEKVPLSSLEFVQDRYLRIVSVDEGEIYVAFDRLQWYHSTPLHEFIADIEGSVLAAMQDTDGKYTKLIAGIKHYRELTNEGLKESKEYCEKLRAKHGYVPDAPF